MLRNNLLRHFRKQQNFSIVEMSACTGISTSIIVGVERYNLYPGPSVRERLSKVLKISESVIWPTLEAINGD